MFDWDDIPDDVRDFVAVEQPLLDEEAGHLQTSTQSSTHLAEVDGVSLEVGDDGKHLSALVPEVPSVRGLPPREASAAELKTLRWMMQKVNLRQDMFLLGPPGPTMRHLVLRFCALHGREVEYVGITRDTNEADLKQRREIRDGHVVYVDQAPVRAALRGSVLVLEGIEKAERNVMPLLNNLLENREMQLEDGRFLLSPGRAAQLSADGDSFKGSKLVPVHPDFIVVALGMPSRGNPLDPPLRSRFSAHVVQIPSAKRPDVCIAPSLLSSADLSRLEKALSDGRPLAGLHLSKSQVKLVSAMLRDHSCGIDLCLVGEKGVGKSALVRSFAALLGYRCQTVFCFKDMLARDLLQRRTTDQKGNTEWHDSPLVNAAVHGELAVLDGVHRLAAGSLSAALGPLLSDREAALPDGSRLVSPGRWAKLCADRGLPAESPFFEEAGVRFRRVHPNFRCLATGEPSTGSGAASLWLDDEVTCLFQFQTVSPLPPEEQLVLAARAVSGSSGGKTTGGTEKVFSGLLAYGEKLRRAACDDPSLEALRLSVRALLRIAGYLKRKPDDVEGSLNRTFSACLRFLPASSQEAVDRILIESFRTAGLVVRGLRRCAATAPSEAESKARRQDLRQLENVAIQARMFGGFGGEEVDDARNRADEDRQDQRAQRLEQLKRKALTGAAALSVIFETKVKEGFLRIGDVSCPVRRPLRPELVPDVSFVNIPQHVEVLRDMLLDWSLGHHLLLVGNQGVGKNKLTDRLLHLLRCEREYIQLHRDTTVQSLTLAPSLKAGVVVWEDSPLVRAVCHGRCLVVDEADKAPLEVVCVLKALCDDGELVLPDGRTLVRANDPRLEAANGGAQEQNQKDGMNQELVPISEGFRMIVLANRPGYPFLGNDFYKVCGDVFSCHAIDNPDIESEVALLRSIGPDVPQERIVQLSLLFTELRDLVEAGQLAYPYSTRELVKLVAHAQRFPEDPLEQVAASVFAFDVADPQKRRPLLEVLQRHGIATTAEGVALLEGRSHGDLNLRLDDSRDKSKDVTRPDNADGQNPPDMREGGPKHGEWDGQEHTGGNMFAGGSGGTGTAGLGGRWGPYRLDVGQKLVMVSEDKKKGLDEATKKKTQQMADEAYRKRLDEIKMSLKDAAEYATLRDVVATQIQEMKVCLEGHEAREREQQWLKNQTHGELDDSRLVDGITGCKTIYTRRGEPDAETFGAPQRNPKRITFVMDISGSMYTFNRIDGRLKRLQEVAAFIFESFAGFESKYDYRMVGHSGTGPEAERLVEWGRPPRTEKERLLIAKTMEAHAQFCHPGDHTLEGTARAIDEIGRQPADERFVFVVSDADLQRYNIDVKRWGQILQKDPGVRAYVILISNNVDEAERIKATLAPGRAHICAEASSLAVTFKQIFKDSMLRDR